MGFVLVHLAPLLEFLGLWAEFLAFAETAETFVAEFKLVLVLFEFLGILALGFSVFVLAEFVFGLVEFLSVFALFVCEIWVL